LSQSACSAGGKPSKSSPPERYQKCHAETRLACDRQEYSNRKERRLASVIAPRSIWLPALNQAAVDALGNLAGMHI
jgi:hypothetical protein